MKTWKWEAIVDKDGYRSGGSLIQISRGKYIVHRWTNDIDNKDIYVNNIYYTPSKHEVLECMLQAKQAGS